VAPSNFAIGTYSAGVAVCFVPFLMQFAAPSVRVAFASSTDLS
jgi:hypothetical protein